MPLSAAGYTIPTEDETFETIVSDFESQTNTTVDRARTDDQIVTAYAKVLANIIRKRDEERLAVYNAGSVNSATGRRLEDLVGIVGVYPKAATYTTDAAVAVTGTVGTVIPAGTLLEQGGNRYRVTDGNNIGGGNTIKIQAVEAGAIVLPVSTLMTIVTPIAGWTTATSSAVTNTGDARETDQELRARRLNSLAATGAGSTASIRAALLALSYVTAAVVIANQSAVPATVQGVLLNGNSLAVWVYPALTAAQQAAVGETIWRKSPAATEFDPPAETYTVNVTDTAGGTQVVKYDVATATAIAVAIKVYLAAGYALADVSTQVATDVTAYFAALDVGQAARVMELFTVVDKIDGIVGADFYLNGAAKNVDYITTLTQVATISGSITIT
mgnify:FL=1